MVRVACANAPKERVNQSIGYLITHPASDEAADRFVVAGPVIRPDSI
jgi:hypothetical protein